MFVYKRYKAKQQETKQSRDISDIIKMDKISKNATQ